MGKEKNNFFTVTGSLIVFLLFLITSKNLIYLVAIFISIMAVMAAIFKTKNLDNHLQYMYMAPLLILQGITLIYIYAFKSLYLYNLYWILYYLIIGVFIFFVLLWVYYLIYRRNSSLRN